MKQPIKHLLSAPYFIAFVPFYALLYLTRWLLPNAANNVSTVCRRLIDSTIRSKYLVIQNKRVKFALHTPNRITNWRFNSIESKEPLLLDWLGTLDGGSLLLDIGANIGSVAIIHCLLDKKNKAICFEPSPFNLKQLSLNIWANHAQDQISIMPFALMDANEPIEMIFPSVEEGGALNEIKVSNHERKLKLFAVNADQFLSKLIGTEIPNAIKIDVDGAELNVLLGLQAILRHKKFKTLYIEIDFRAHNNATMILELLESVPRLTITSSSRYELHSFLNRQNAVINTIWEKVN